MINVLLGLFFIGYSIIVPIYLLKQMKISLLLSYISIYIIPIVITIFFWFKELWLYESDIYKILYLIVFFIFIISFYIIVLNERVKFYNSFIKWKKYFSDKKYENISNKFQSKTTVKNHIDDNNIGYLELVLNSKAINFYIKYNLPSWYLWYKDFLNIPIPIQEFNQLFSNCSSEEEFERILIKSYWNFTDDEIKIILKNG